MNFGLDSGDAMGVSTGTTVAEATGNSALRRAHDVVGEYMRDGRYGAIQLIFEAGRLTTIRKEETIKV